MRRDPTPIDPDGADTCRALAFAMLWTLVVVVVLAGTAIAWTPAQ